MNIYFKTNHNPIVCCIIYVNPLYNFNLKNNSDVTALHLAEHCAFIGNRSVENERSKHAYQFGRGTLEGKITKQWLGFILSFYPQFYQDTILWFTQFINQIKVESTLKEINFHKKELKEELSSKSFPYFKYSALRKKIFTNPPFSLSSGGKIKLIDKITQDQINNYKKTMTTNGQFFLSIPENIKLVDFEQFVFKSFLHAPKTKNIDVEIKQDTYSSANSQALVLPIISSQARAYLLGIFDYFRNKYDCFDLEYDISLFRNISILFLVKTKINHELQLLVNFFKDQKSLTKAKKFAEASMQEDWSLVQADAEDLALDWVNNQINKTFDADDLLLMIKVALEKIV